MLVARQQDDVSRRLLPQCQTSNLSQHMSSANSRQCIWAYAFDAAAGTIGNRTIVVQRGVDEGEADGLLVDRSGNLYTFIWEGGCVLRYSGTTGEILQKWDLNATRVTHGAWIGPEYTNLLVTTARSDDELPAWEGEEGGGLFCITGCKSPGLRKKLFGV